MPRISNSRSLVQESESQANERLEVTQIQRLQTKGSRNSNYLSRIGAYSPLHFILIQIPLKHFLFLLHFTFKPFHSDFSPRFCIDLSKSKFWNNFSSGSLFYPLPTPLSFESIECIPNYYSIFLLYTLLRHYFVVYFYTFLVAFGDFGTLLVSCRCPQAFYFYVY